MKQRLNILDIWVDSVSHDQAIGYVREFLQGDRPMSIFAANPEKNFSVPKDPQLFKVFRRSDLLIPDGIGIVLAARLLHGKILKRIPGVEFMYDICSLAEKEKRSVFIFGARENVNKSAVEKLHQKYPALQIAGRCNGYVPDARMPELIKQINDSGADILFLGLGSPKQEKWFATHAKELLHVKVCQGIGGTLDTISGSVKRAPEIWQKFSLEWLYRLLSEPTRISRQKFLPVFFFKVLIAAVQVGHR